MSGKYKKGKQIKSVGDFENSSSRWFRVVFGKNERTKHRSFLESWQYHTLYIFIKSGRVHEAELIQKEKDIQPVTTD